MTRSKLKSKVKAAGLKSVVHLDKDNKQKVMTNFTESPLELKVTDDNISRISDIEKEVFNATKKCENHYSITSNRTPPQNDDGSKGKSTIGEWYNSSDSPDPLGLREKTLAIIFNNSDKITDNLHIQVAQQILDFQKVFAVYANHLEHIFNNMCEADDDWLSTNFIANKDMKKLLKEFEAYRQNAKPYLTYFGIKYEPLKDITDGNKFDDDLYMMVSAVSMLRNAIMHTEPQATDYILDSVVTS